MFKSTVFMAYSLVAILTYSVPMSAEHYSPQDAKENSMSAKGEFDIQLEPQADENFEMGRMTLQKTFRGSLIGNSTGQMLSVRTAVEGSAGYVALEHFAGELEGRAGSFYLQHSGTMSGGSASATISVVPDSGTEKLVGLSGEMTINIIDGQHVYEFTYSFE